MAFNPLDPNNSRFEKSLGLLTSRFVSLLQESDGGILDLKVAADTLNVRQKRRIYDITNVLEGIGLIEKRNKNCIVWKGAVAGENSQEASDRIKVLQEEINTLEHHEKMLDQQKSWAQQSIKNILDDISNYQLAYITHEDICSCFDGQTLLAIQAPTGTQLEVPIPEIHSGQLKKYQIHLKSENGQIYVLLVNKDAGAEPLVVQVPPPQEVAEAIQQHAEEAEDDEDAAEDHVLPDLSEKHLPDFTDSILEQGGQQRFKREEFSDLELAEDSYSDRDNSVEGTLTVSGKRDSGHLSNPGSKRSVAQDYAMPHIGTEIPGLDELISSEVFGPLLRLSPPPSEKDYCFNLDNTEGVCDLFDVL